MKSRVMILPLLGALGLLAGCTKSSGNAAERLGKLEAENAELQQKLATLSADFRSLEQRTDQMDLQNRSLEKMLTLAEQDLRSRLLEMVQQEMGGGGRGFGKQRLAPAAVLPKAYLGFDAETNSPETAKKLGLSVATGVVLTEVTEGAPGDLAGLRKGDVLQSIDGKPVKTRDELALAFAELKPGQDCQLGLVRAAEEMKLKAKVGAR